METCIAILDDKFKIIAPIGNGGTSQVFLAKEDSLLYAIKILKKDGDPTFSTEVNALEKIKHQNIIQLYFYGHGLLSLTDGSAKLCDFIAMEYCDNKELLDYIVIPAIIKKWYGFDEALGRLIFIQILEAVEACHMNGFVHSDLKTDNVLLGSNFEIKLADFGYCKNIEGELNTGLQYTISGTRKYFPPEILNETPYYGVCNDVFCLGAILSAVVTGYLPWKDFATNNDPIYKYIANEESESFFTAIGISHTSAQFQSLLSSMVAYHQEMRPSIDEIKSHPWIVEGYKDQANPEIVQKLFDEFLIRKTMVEKERQKARPLKIISSPNISGTKSVNGEYQSREEKKESGVFLENINFYNATFVGNAINEKIIMNSIYMYYQTKEGGKETCTEIECKYGFRVEVALSEAAINIMTSFPHVVIPQLTYEMEIKKINDNTYVLDCYMISGDKTEFAEQFDDLVKFLIDESAE